ncbi:MAG: YfhO family protein [Bacteroidota bacterium]
MRIETSQWLPHLAAVVIFTLLSCAYFAPQFSGKSIRQGDVLSYRGMSQEIKEFKAETGEESLWTNSMFGGMPTYQISAVSSGNGIKKLENVLRLFLKPPAGQFIAAMLSFYLLMVLLGVSPWLSVIGAITFAFSTNNLVLYEAGHETKLRTISYLPLVASGLLLAFRKHYILGGLLFGIGFGMDLAANHVQMTYVFGLTVVIWGIAELVKNIKAQTMLHFAKAAGVLLIGGLLAIGSAASNLFVTYEYSQDTMRGKPILESSSGGNSGSSSQVDGLAFDYAMNWSNSSIDLFSSFIPGVAGGGSAEPVSSSSPYAKAMSRLGGGRPEQAPLYWGGLPFTSGPIYFGAVMCLFFLVGLFIVKGPVKYWLGLGVLFTLLLSMGKNLEGLNRFIFEYFPLYNKFRTPNSVLSVTAFLIPALGVLALHQIITQPAERKAQLRALLVSTGILGAIALFFALMGPSFFTLSGANDGAPFAQAGPEIQQTLVKALRETRAELMTSDAWRTLLLVLAAAGLTYGYLKDKLKLPILLAGLGALCLFDVVSVGQRYVSADDFQRSTTISNAEFAPRPVDQQILADPDPHYRVFDATVSSFQSARPSYHHKTVGGYHAAKLQRFQDLIDRHLTAGNQRAFDMLNTKYFIVPGQGGQAAVQQNPGALGNGWFVDSIAMVPNANAEIDALNQVDIGRVAIVHQEYKDYVAGLNTSGFGTIKLTEYRPNRLTYTADTNSDALAVFSEVWYGPDKGWKATIDGKAVDHIRVNYLLRGLKIPAGQHEIVFEFDPATYRLGKGVSMASSAILLLGLLGFIGWSIKERMNTPEPVVAAEKPTKKPKRKKK